MKNKSSRRWKKNLRKLQTLELFRRATLRRGHKDSGQALVESVIGLALLSFALAIIAIVSFMTVQRTRTMMAARHAAWIGGNGVGSQAVIDYSIKRGFFYETNLVHLIDNPPIDGAGASDGSAESFVSDLVDSALGVNNAQSSYRVEYGFGADTSTEDLPFPLILIRYSFPIVSDGQVLGENNFENAVRGVRSDCHWDEVSETWECMGGMLSDIADNLDIW